MTTDPLSEAREALRDVMQYALFDGDLTDYVREHAIAAMSRLDALPTPRRLADGPTTQGWFYPDSPEAA